MGSYYTNYSNTNPDGSSIGPWQALKDVFLHPLDTGRAFVAAPIALGSGLWATVAEKVSGISTPTLADLPAQPTIAETVGASTSDATTPAASLPEQSILPTWVKVTIAAAAIVGAVVFVKRAAK